MASSFLDSWCLMNESNVLTAIRSRRPRIHRMRHIEKDGVAPPPGIEPGSIEVNSFVQIALIARAEWGDMWVTIPLTHRVTAWPLAIWVIPP